MEKQINVLIADADTESAEMLSRNITGDFKINVCGIVSNGYQLIEKVDILKPDVVVMDLVLPNIDGIGVLERLRSKQKEFDNMAVGSAQKNLYVPVLSAMQIEIPQQYDYEKFNLLFSSIKSKQKENMKLTELQSLLLAKMGQ